MRIVSLIPSGTEIVHSLGMAQNIVGRSHGCDFPAFVKKLPILTEAKCVTNGTSQEIDFSVREILELATSVYKVDTELLKSLKPDVIITQTQCDICAVSLKDLEGMLKELSSEKLKIVNLQANSLADIYTDIEKVAEALEVEQKGKLLIEDLKEKIELISKNVKDSPAHRIFCLGWIEPLMTSGNWIPELVSKAHAVEVLAKPEEHSYTFLFEKLLELQPEYLIVMPCGFSIERTEKEMVTLTSHKDWNQLSCVKEKKVYLVDGHAYFNRPGPRIVESVEILTEILHPEKVEIKHQWTSWKSAFASS